MDDDPIHRVPLSTESSLDIPPRKILEALLADDDLETIFVLGRTTDGNGVYACSMTDKGKILWHVAEFVQALMRGDFD